MVYKGIRVDFHVYCLNINAQKYGIAFSFCEQTEKRNKRNKDEVANKNFRDSIIRTLKTLNSLL